jgi:signal transduction histidine kinase
MEASMDIARESIAEKRESTDASLGAERARTDAAAIGLPERARRLAAALVERERILVDRQLRKLRDDDDLVLARERLAAKAPRDSVTSERERADTATLGERARNDSFVQRERQRSDTAIQTERSEHDADPSERACRADTDEKLEAERRRVDRAVASLGSTEEALSVAKGEIERRSDVLAMVAHELRNPLSVIAMNTDFIAEGLPDGEARVAAEEVTSSVARMQRLISDLVDLARIEGGTLRVALRPLDVGALLGEIRAAYAPLFARRGVTFTCGPCAPGFVATFDHDRILQVLSNLLSNAMKFTPSGGMVSLSMERRADDIELAVKDTGAGIAGAALPRVFNRFWQACGDPGTGLGLGLYICEKIVTAHAGRIWVESEPGKGTTFRFTLPASPPGAWASDSPGACARGPDPRRDV